MGAPERLLALRVTVGNRAVLYRSSGARLFHRDCTKMVADFKRVSPGNPFCPPHLTLSAALALTIRIMHVVQSECRMQPQWWPPRDTLVDLLPRSNSTSAQYSVTCGTYTAFPCCGQRRETEALMTKSGGDQCQHSTFYQMWHRPISDRNRSFAASERTGSAQVRLCVLTAAAAILSGQMAQLEAEGAPERQW